jgi:Na+-translocating ferredoxin:NAD+ oxidoreductase RnfD subunit
MSSTTMTLSRAVEPAFTDRLKRFLRTPKGALAALCLPLAALAAGAVGWQAAVPHLATAVIGACLVDLVAARMGRNGWRWPTSAFLSGLIVGFVLGPEQSWIITLAVGGLATASKYLVRTGRGHILNPAAVALLISVPLYGTTQSWWGALPDLPWPWLLALVACGMFIVDRVNKFPLVLSFMGTYFGLLTIGAFIDPPRVAELFRAPFVQAAVFFACFMLTDPPTSPARSIEQVLIGPLVAVVSCVAQLLGLGQLYLLVGLVSGNLGLVGWRLASGTAPPRGEAEPA